MTQPVLVADIGATHARFALAVDGDDLVQRRRYPSAGLASGQAALEQYLADVGVPVAGAALAVAGPVVDRVGTLTNQPLEFSAKELEIHLRLGRVEVINDFVAVSAAVPFLERDGVRSLGDGAPGHAMKAVLGPGTGLGMGMLLPISGDWCVLPSEGGHGDLAATNALESELLEIIRATRAHVSWEAVLSGPGLVNLYRAMCTVWGSTPEHDEPSTISALGVSADDPVCHQTLETFCHLLGTAAGNLAVTVCADGGVYIAGGIVRQIVDFVDQSHFRRRFEERGRLSPYVERIATCAIIDPDVGLKGAARIFTSRRLAGGFQVPDDRVRLPE